MALTERQEAARGLFKGTALADPVYHMEAITKSDATEYDPPLRGIYIGGAGNVAVIGADDSAAVTLTALAVGVWHPIAVKKVMSTNTTATAIVGGR